MKFIYNYIPILSLSAIPALVYAQSSGGLGSFRDIVNGIVSFITGNIFPVLIILAVLAFFWNIVNFMVKLDAPTERDNFRKYSINSLLAIFVLLSIWGIVGIATKTIFGSSPFVPQLQVKEE